MTIIKSLVLGVILVFGSQRAISQVDFHLGYGPQFIYNKYDHKFTSIDYPELTDSIQSSYWGLGLSYSLEGFYQVGERSFVGGGVFPTVGFTKGQGFDNNGLYVELPVNFEYWAGEDEYSNFFGGLGLNTIWRDNYNYPGQIGFELAAGMNLYLGDGAFKARLSYTRGIVSMREVLRSAYSDVYFNSNMYSIGLYFMY